MYVDPRVSREQILADRRGDSFLNEMGFFDAHGVMPHNSFQGKSYPIRG